MGPRRCHGLSSVDPLGLRTPSCQRIPDNQLSPRLRVRPFETTPQRPKLVLPQGTQRDAKRTAARPFPPFASSCDFCGRPSPRLRVRPRHTGSETSIGNEDVATPFHAGGSLKIHPLRTHRPKSSPKSRLAKTGPPVSVPVPISAERRTSTGFLHSSNL